MFWFALVWWKICKASRQHNSQVHNNNSIVTLPSCLGMLRNFSGHPFVCLFLFFIILFGISLCATKLCRVLVLGNFFFFFCWNRVSLFWNRGNDPNRNTTRFSDLGELHHSSSVFHHEDAADLSSSNPLSLLYMVAPYKQSEWFSVLF